MTLLRIYIKMWFSAFIFLLLQKSIHRIGSQSTFRKESNLKTDNIKFVNAQTSVVYYIILIYSTAKAWILNELEYKIMKKR